MRVSRVYVFGPPLIEIDGNPVAFHRTRALALLAYLATTRTPQPRDDILALLWPTFETIDARNNLRRELSYLRVALGTEALVADRTIARLDSEYISSDLWEFENHLAESQEHGKQHSGAICDDCARAINKAVNLYTADFLAGFGLPDSLAFDIWQNQVRERLSRDALASLKLLGEWHLGRSEFEQAASVAHRSLVIDPFHEPAHRILMQSFDERGQKAAALRHYERLRQTLANELGVDPSAETTELYQAIRHHRSGVGTNKVIPAKSSQPTYPAPESKTVIRLPDFATSFVKRRLATEKVISLLTEPDTRLLTLVGTGGMGKTRMAVEAARRLSEGEHRFNDGIYFVALAGLNTVEDIPSAIARAIDFDFRSDGGAATQNHQLLNYLSNRRILLILDNLEHLLAEGGADFPTRIAREAPETAVLVTSRFRLNVSGEKLYQVTGMEVPPVNAASHQDIQSITDYGAVGLFLQVAQRVRPDFRLSDENVAVISAICQRLGGMPLAIEMAAAWVEILSPEEIQKEIGQNPDILSSDMIDIPERQRSIRAVFDSSHRLLSGAEKTILSRLSIFRDGFTRDAAQAVAASEFRPVDFLRIVLSLVHKSWLGQDDNGRFRIHELLREYAEDKLGANHEIMSEQHAHYYARFLDEQWPALSGGGEIAACDAILADLGNILAAWEWFVRQGNLTPIARQMLLPMHYFTEIRSWHENYSRLLDWTIGKVPSGTVDAEYLMIRTSRLLRVRVFWMTDKKLEEVWRLSTLLSDPAGMMGVWYIWLVAEYGAHIDRLTSLQILRELHAKLHTTDSWLLFQTQLALGNLIRVNWSDMTELMESQSLLKQAAEGFERSGDTLAQTHALIGLAFEASSTIQLEEQLNLFDRARTLSESINLTVGGWQFAWHRSGIHLRMGRPDLIFLELDEQLAFARQRGDKHLACDTLTWVSTFALRYTTTEHALRTRHEALAISEEIGSTINIAWNHWNLGEIHRVMGEYEKARHYFEMADQEFRVEADKMGLSYVEFGIGSLALSTGDYEVAWNRLNNYVELSRTLPSNWWNVENGLLWLTRAEINSGRHDLATTTLLESLRQLVRTETYELAGVALAVLAELALAAGQPTLCATLCRLLLAFPQTWNETREQLEILFSATGPARADLSKTITQAELEKFIKHLAELPDAPSDEWLARASDTLERDLFRY